MKILYFALFTLLNFPAFAMNEPLNPIPPSQGANNAQSATEFYGEVAPGVYAGHTRVGKEIVYFGMEKIDEKNKKNWDKYKEYSRRLTENSRGLLAVWPSRLKEIRKVPFEQLQNITGFTDELELSQFLDKLEKVVQDNKNVIAALRGIPTGVAGFYIGDDGNYYVVYASKRPVTGRFPFPDNLPDSISLKKYYEYFGDLLMIFRSEIEPGTHSYDNRGIFKSPISFIEDGNKYPGLSLKLHGFSGVVAQYISKDIQYMTVSPAPGMRRILVMAQGWRPGDLTINGKDLFEITKEEFAEQASLEAFGEEPNYRIKTEALIRLFRGE